MDMSMAAPWMEVTVQCDIEAPHQVLTGPDAGLPKELKDALWWGVVELAEFRMAEDPSRMFDCPFMIKAKRLIGEEYPEIFTEEWHRGWNE